MSKRLCVKACNKYLNLNYACFMCHDILYVVHAHFMQIYIFECLKCNDEGFLVNMLSIEKTEGSGFINWMFQFYWFCLAKLDGPVCQTGLSDFDRLTICFSSLICCDSLFLSIS
jgi:hypothetical protein